MPPSPKFGEDLLVKVYDLPDQIDRWVLTHDRLAAQDRGDNLGLVNRWCLSAVVQVS